MNYLVSIVGPTGTGKSRLALHLAQSFNGEIVNADSRQIFRYMDIGTDKPNPGKRELVPHHLVDIIYPDQAFSLAQYQELASKAIASIHRRRKLPLLVGGSGLYVLSVVEGWQIPRVPPDLEFRRGLEAKVKEAGGEDLYRQLELIDPVAAREIDPRNVRRIIRALEVYQASGTPSSRHRGKKAPAFQTLIIGLTTERESLYRRVDTRIDDMIQQGLVEEVKKLLDAGYHPGLPAMSSIGYRQIGMFLGGELSLQDAIRQIKTETHRLVRHQYNWFRLTDKRIQWFDIGEDISEKVTAAVAGFLKR